MNRSRSKVPTSRAPRRASLTLSSPIVADAAWIARRLLSWYRRHRRDLPWRRTRDPYAIWVSETMLQQTRVATAIPYYRAFLREFPNPRRLAAAPIERVLARWSGLGYYTRARHLHAAARLVVERHGGGVPGDEAALAALPGIGPYTRGAILSIAFEHPVPLLDGNVARVLARLFAIPGDPRRPAVSRRLWSIAAALVPRRAPGDFNQGLMELGALVCAPRAPRCPACPLRERCRAHRIGRVSRFPTPRARRPTALRQVAAAIFESRAGVWLEEIGAGINRGLLDLPEIEGAAAGARGTQRLGVVRHGILDTRYVVEVWHVRAPGRARSKAGRWVKRDALAEAPLTARAKKAMSLLEETLG